MINKKMANREVSHLVVIFFNTFFYSSFLLTYKTTSFITNFRMAEIKVSIVSKSGFLLKIGNCIVKSKLLELLNLLP